MNYLQNVLYQNYNQSSAMEISKRGTVLKQIKCTEHEILWGRFQTVLWGCRSTRIKEAEIGQPKIRRRSILRIRRCHRQTFCILLTITFNVEKWTDRQPEFDSFPPPDYTDIYNSIYISISFRCYIQPLVEQNCCTLCNFLLGYKNMGYVFNMSYWVYGDWWRFGIWYIIILILLVLWYEVYEEEGKY